jgi:hypothetical protein
MRSTGEAAASSAADDPTPPGADPKVDRVSAEELASDSRIVSSLESEVSTADRARSCGATQAWWWM